MPFFFNSIYIVHDEVKDKSFELELSWVGEGSKDPFVLVLKRKEVNMPHVSKCLTDVILHFSH